MLQSLVTTGRVQGYTRSINKAEIIAMAPACATCMAFPASVQAAVDGRSSRSIIGLPAVDASDGTENNASLD